MWANHLVVVDMIFVTSQKSFHFNKFQLLQRSTTPKERECNLRVLGVHNSNSMHFHFVWKCIFNAPKDPSFLEKKCNLRVLGVHNFDSMHFHFVWNFIFTFLENTKAQSLFQTNPLGLAWTLVMSLVMVTCHSTTNLLIKVYLHSC